MRLVETARRQMRESVALDPLRPVSEVYEEVMFLLLLLLLLSKLYSPGVQ